MSVYRTSWITAKEQTLQSTSYTSWLCIFFIFSFFSDFSVYPWCDASLSLTWDVTMRLFKFRFFPMWNVKCGSIRSYSPCNPKQPGNNFTEAPMNSSMLPCTGSGRQQLSSGQSCFPLSPSETIPVGAPTYYHNCSVQQQQYQQYQQQQLLFRQPPLFPPSENWIPDGGTCVSHPVLRQQSFPTSQYVPQGAVSFEYHSSVPSTSFEISPSSPRPQVQALDLVHRRNSGMGMLVHQKSDRSDPLPLVVSTKNLLHRVCFHSLSLDRVLKILKVDPAAAANAASVDFRQKRWEWSPRERIMVARFQRAQAPYKYPLHLVFASTARISRNPSNSSASIEEATGDSFFVARNRKLDDCVLIAQILLRSAPNVLLSLDGSSRASSLAILLKEWSERCSHDPTLLHHCLGLIEKLVSINPALVHQTDRHNSSALHVVCQNSAPLILVRAVYSLNPLSLSLRNLHGHTPLQISQHRMGIGSMINQERVVNFLQERFDAAQGCEI